jgi:predicted enzyme related to lactoylglutathione lyase
MAGGTAIGALRGAEGKITPFNGIVFIQVSDLPASCKKAQELGGTLPEGFPFNPLDGTGAVAVVLDPVGHPVGMYSRTSLPSVK